MAGCPTDALILWYQMQAFNFWLSVYFPFILFLPSVFSTGCYGTRVPAWAALAHLLLLLCGSGAD